MVSVCQGLFDQESCEPWSTDGLIDWFRWSVLSLERWQKYLVLLQSTHTVNLLILLEAACGITTCLMCCTFLIPWCDFCVKKKFHLWFLLLNVSFMSKGQEHGTFSWRCLVISFWTGLADQRLYKDKMPGPPLRRAYSQVGRVGFSFLQEKWKWLQIENEAVLITSLCILSVDVFCFIDSCTLSLMEWSAFMYIADD